MPDLLIDWLIRTYPASKKTTLKQMIDDGRVTINGRPANRLKTPIAATDKIVVAERARQRASVGPSLSPLTVVYEDADLLVIDKPPGLLTSTGPREKRPTALAIITSFYASNPRVQIGLVHRLDRDASGLLVFAKTPPAIDSLKSQFFHHSVGRVYEAFVHGSPRQKKGTIESYLIESKEGKIFNTRDTRRGQRAVTHVEVIDSANGVSRLRVKLETGRKHQIRVHLSTRGHPIVGDNVYGPQPPKSDRLQLRAIELDLDHPRTGKRMEFRAAGLEA